MHAIARVFCLVAALVCSASTARAEEKPLLKGDRDSAAQVLASFAAFRDYDCTKGVQHSPWQGNRNAVRFLKLVCNSEDVHWPDVIEGRPDSVIVAGSLTLSSDGEKEAVQKYWLVWKRGPDGAYRIVSLDAGKTVVVKN